MPNNSSPKLSLPISLILTSIITIIGWWIVGNLNSSRDRQNKLREIKITYLIDAYRKLANASQRNPNIASYHRDIESAIADIQLFGTESQIDKLKETIRATKYDSLVRLDLSIMLSDLRNSLRKEIDLIPINDNVQWFRFSEKDTLSSK